MTISFIYNGEPMIGTANDDFFIAFSGSTGTSNNTVNGNNGDDLVIGDSSDTYIPSAATLNGTIGTAFNLEGAPNTWTTGENQMFGDWTIPHATVMAEATIGQSEFYRIAIGAGQQITIDLDFASNTAIGNTRDLVVELQDSLGNVIVTADDSLLTQGGRGSFPSAPGSAASYDPYLTYTVPSGGIYYINVRPFGAGPGATFTDNNTFVMNVSVTGHATAAANPVQGADTINGGFGDDALFGQGGSDVINGDDGDDLIDSGSGGDIVHGGEGNDTLYGGDDTEENIHGDNGDDRLISGGEGHYYGDAGDDIIYAGLTSVVNEILDGGADIDTIDTTTWAGSYSINLVTGATNFGESFTNFENVVSGNGGDTITGTSGANVIITNGGTDTVNAGAGDDLVSGGADGDTLDGGADFDILSYRTSSGAVTINLAVNTVSGGHAAGDFISNFEGVWGSVLGDTLTADAGNNELRGFEGNDILSGGIGNDILDGGLNNDTMIGGLGDDTMTGDLGDDTYFVDSLGDTVNELAGQGTDTLALDFSYALADGSAIEWLATIDPLATKVINLSGNADINSITGNAGNNILDGGGGVDTLIGLGGDDFYVVDNAADVVIELAGWGTDRVFASTSYTLGAGVYVETLTTLDNASTAAINLTGNELANSIVGNVGNNILNGGGGADVLNGQTGDDFYVVDNAADVVIELAGWGTDRVFATASYALGAGMQVEMLTTLDIAGTAAINLTGNELVDSIIGNAGNNILNGGGGADVLNGQTGDDFYVVDNAADVVIELAGWGTDRVFASTSYTLGAGVYVETLTTLDNASTAAINLTGNELANSIVGNVGNNILNGGGGADVLNGQTGDDFYVVDNAADVVIELAGWGTDRVFATASYALGAGMQVEMLTTLDIAGTAAINLTGNELVDSIIGNAGNNILNGGGGADVLNGQTGDDFYVVDNAADVVIELAGWGTDRVFASTSYTLGAGVYVETLTTLDNASTAAINLTGNELANSIVGNVGNNILNGGGGADVLNGQTGDDFYVVDNAADVVIELAGWGTDRVFATASYALGAGMQVEMLTTLDIAGTAAINLTGNELVDSIIGNAGNNILNGGGGADVLNGQTGDDFYVVDNAADVVIELAGWGTDRVFASTSYTLGAGVYVETLTTLDNASTAAINLTGNELANSIVGNVGNNILNGGGGADVLNGQTGDDFYVVDNAADVVIELAGWGTDRVFATASYALGAGMQVEMLTTLDIAGTAAINLTGNELVDSIIGNAGNNILNGGGGADVLNGQTGDDFYVVDNAADVVIELAGWGTDRVFASTSYTLGAGMQVEMLTTLDNASTAAINLTGNELANSIVGNAGNNILDGGSGADVLNGFGGADAFRFTTALGGGNIDAIQGYGVADDVIHIDNAVFTGLADGALAAGAFQIGAAAADADDRIIYNSATGALLFDADGIGAGAAIQFAILDSGLAMAASEFLVI